MRIEPSLAGVDDFVAQLLGRHRYQLRLMTMTVEEACAHAPRTTAVAPSSAVEMTRADSVWDALGRMDTDGSAFIRIEQGPATKAPC